MRTANIVRLFGLISGLVALGQFSASADMTLTATGQNEGFTLTTFATNFPSNGLGPLGIGFPADGGVLVSDGPGNVRHFATDVDNQNAANAPVGANYGSGKAFDMVTTPSGIVYMGQRDAGQIVQLNSDGSLDHVVATGLGAPHGIVADPANGHLIVATFTQKDVWDVNPTNGAVSLLFHASLDGLTINADGTVLYGAAAPQGTDRIYGYSLVSGNVGSLIFDSGTVAGGPDGAALGYGPLSGNIYVNTNSGTIIEINLSTKAQTVIATGGTRGDFAVVDNSNGSMLLTQSNKVLRLSNDGSFSIPEPSSFLLLGLGGLGLIVCRARSASVPRS